jgi:hypothetical protein
MKFILTILILFTAANTDILYIKKKRCILDQYYFKDAKFNYTYSSTGRSASTSKFKSSDLKFGYEYDANNDKCQKLNVLQTTHLAYHDYKFLVSLVGVFLGFMVAFFILSVFTRGL